MGVYQGCGQDGAILKQRGAGSYVIDMDILRRSSFLFLLSAEVERGFVEPHGPEP